MAMRMTGLISGMDTESVIQELVAVRQIKVDDAKKAQTKLEWKQEAWKELNSKIYKLYTSSLSELRFSTSYTKRTTKVSNPNAVSIITGDKAVNGVQSLKVDTLAKTGYLTGKQLSVGEKYSDNTVLTDNTDDGGMGLEVGSKLAVQVGGSTTQIEITEGMTIGQLTEKLQAAGVNATFDQKNQRFFISSKESGGDNDFVLAGTNTDGVNALVALGVGSYDDLTKYADGASALTQDEIDASVENRLKNILAAVSAAENNIADVASKLQTYGMTDTNGLSAADLKTKIDEFKATEQYEKLTDAQKSEIDKHAEKLTEYENTLAENADYYTVNDEGAKVANQTLVDEVTAELEEVNSGLTEAATWAKANLNKADFEGEDAARRIKGSNAVIYLNGARFESTTNTFEVNGLTYTVNATTAENEEITITTEDDTEGIYDMIKGFLKQYNELINEMDKLYGADVAKDYEPLTDDEKSAMSEDAVEKWEKKIKDGLLSKDSTLYNVSSALKEMMSSAVTMNDGTKKYLSEFGIETLGYFMSPDNEKNAYHIAGDPDDEYTSSEADKLKSMIATDPDAVVDFFVNLSRNMYTRLGDLMKRTDYSSAYTVYNDKSMKDEYNDYTAEIKELEQKLADYEDKWYKKFSAMETAMAKMQSNASAITSLLGGM